MLIVSAGALVLPACLEEPEDVEGVAWNGDANADDDDDAVDDDDAASETSGAGGGSGNASDPDTGDDSAGDPTDPSGTTDPSDSDTTDPTDDSAGESTGGDPTDDPTDDTGPPPSDEVPDNAYCSDVAMWDAQHLALEDEILEIVNQVRAQGANCGSSGSFGPAGPMTMAPALRCAARVHSKDMADRNFFDHTNPSGESPFDRMGMAGYNFSTAGENIAAGNPTAAATMDQWMNSDGHCGNIMNPDFTEIGVGYYPGGQYGHLWTQVFGRP